MHVDEYDNRQEPWELSLFLYDLRVIEKRHVNYFTLLLNVLAIVVEVIVGEQLHGDTMMEIMMMEIMVSCR